MNVPAARDHRRGPFSVTIRTYKRGNATMLHLFMLHITGTAGGLAVKRLKVPAGAMLGAIAAVVLFNLVTGGDHSYPIVLKRAVQVISGVVIGSRVGREDVIRLKTMLAPAAILVGMLTGFNVAAARLIAHRTDLTAITALFAAAPGGMSDLVLICADFGADPQQVTILQIFRYVIVVVLFPLVMKKMFLSGPVRALAQEKAPDAEKGLPQAGPASRWQPARVALSLVAATAGGLGLQLPGVPAGTITGAVVATAALNIVAGKGPVPKAMKTVVQVGAGCYIGAQITVSSIGSLYELILPMTLIVVEMLLMTFVTGWVIHKATGLDKATALFSCIPGGITEMGIMAEELNLDIPRILLMHTCRVIFVICMMPVLLGLLSA